MSAAPAGDLRLSQHVHVQDGLRAMTPVYDANTRRGRDIRIPSLTQSMTSKFNEKLWLKTVKQSHKQRYLNLTSGLHTHVQRPSTHHKFFINS